MDKWGKKAKLNKHTYILERRGFDQKYKFRNRNDMVCGWRNFPKKSFDIFTYVK